jgi:hypothetical protein
MKAATVEVKQYHGRVIVYTTGRTGRGQSFIKDKRILGCKSMADKKFKAEMAQAVVEMLGDRPSDIQYGLNIDD